MHRKPAPQHFGAGLRQGSELIDPLGVGVQNTATRIAGLSAFQHLRSPGALRRLEFRDLIGAGTRERSCEIPGQSQIEVSERIVAADHLLDFGPGAIAIEAGLRRRGRQRQHRHQDDDNDDRDDHDDLDDRDDDDGDRESAVPAMVSDDDVDDQHDDDADDIDDMDDDHDDDFDDDQDDDSDDERDDDQDD